ncbi:MAG: aldo/keto reductase [Oscillospiraceae bacterium]|nr:aldo/keto reductase [Oscillospiraceae bacterium]
MKYRKLGKTGIETSEIGMGLEYLLDKDEKTIKNTVKAAFDGGVNYFDCHMGHDFKENPIDYEGYAKLGKALQGIRDKFCLTHIANSAFRSPADAQPRFESYLKALNTGHSDVFIIQFCDKADDYGQVMGENGLFSYAKKLKSEGKTRAVGISTHSSEIALKAIEDGYDMLMYPVNPAFDVVIDEKQYKTENLDSLWDAAHDFKAEQNGAIQPRKNVYIECERKGVGLAAMKPFAGGFIFRVEKDVGFTPVNLISYALAQIGVSTVVPGCANPNEIEEILAYCNCAEELRDYSGAVSKSRWSVMGNCLYCNHCLPCKSGINIGQVNKLIDAFSDSPDLKTKPIKDRYLALPVKASSCKECGACEKLCPFGVNVIKRLKRAVEFFGS